MCHDFNSVAEASYAAWEVQNVWDKVMESIEIGFKDWYIMYTIPRGVYQSDEEIWEQMAKAIGKPAMRIGLVSRWMLHPILTKLKIYSFK